ncbi:shikimate kinase [Trichoderma harzianum]|uniref:Shikimate kinase n=1 Tax=Trichoderma harzianum TaxID=5544 RepID=A0A0G0AAP0_TRIHA|nr:shikimate kinase [Trichoderma harzianum]
MYDETIILIGPEGSGKSTIGKILAKTLSKELYTLDRHRDELYAPYGYDKDLAAKIYEEKGLWAFYQHWKTFEYKTVSHILQNASQEGDQFYGKILDFGAGHSVFEDPQQLENIEALIKPYENVILVMPCEDVDEVVKIKKHGGAMSLASISILWNIQAIRSLQSILFIQRTPQLRNVLKERFGLSEERMQQVYRLPQLRMLAPETLLRGLGRPSP